MALADFQSLIDNLVRDQSSDISTDDRDQALELAVVRYSTDRAIEAVEEVAAAGTIHLALPEGWDPGFSRLTAVEIPDGADGCEVGSALELTLSGLKIRMEQAFTSGTVLHVRYTLPHAVDDSTDTVPLADRAAVAKWAAALLLDQLATLYAGDRDPVIAADSANWASKSRDYASRAKELRTQYLDHLGIDPKRTVAAGAVVDFDRDSSLGFDRLVHNRRRR
jgi:hypothetical protein